MEKTTDKGEQMTPPKGYKHTELGVLPEDWEVVRLGDVCEINPKSLELPDTFIYIDLESVSKGKLCSVKYMKKTNAPSRAKRTLQRHDILFQMVRPYQKNNLYFNLEGGYVASTGYAQIRTKQSSGFIFQYIHTQTFVERVIEKCTGSNYPAINATDLSQIEIPLPPLAEQEKIAEILSTWDTQIQNFESLITEKQALKKGLCQTLLTAKTRLKGFSEDWEVVRLGDVCEICNGFAFQSKNFKESGSPIVRISNIKSNNTISLEDMVYFSFDDYKNKNLNKFAIYQNDILVALSGATTGKIGKLKEDVVLYLNQRIGKFQPSERLNSDFLFQCLLLQSDFILLLSGGGAQPNLSTTTIKDKVLISLPPLAEQEKIAEILSEVDNEITLLEQKLESLKSQKKGIMQKLLNGKVRVRI